MQNNLVRKRRVRLALWAMATLCFIFGACLLQFCYQLAYFSVHPPRRKITRTPAHLGLKFENIKFASTDGLTLRGWFIPAVQPDAVQPRGVIICCHGYPGLRSDQLEYIKFLHRAGFSTLTFDFRALGESEGKSSSIGYLETKDALGAVAYLRQRSGTKDLSIGIFGVSMGAAVSLMAAARSDDIKAVVADSPYASLDHAILQHFKGLGMAGAPLALTTRWFGERMIGINSSYVSPLNEVPKISPRPLLLIHGDRDLIIPPEDSRLLFAAAGQPKELWMLPGVQHGMGHRAAPREYKDKVTQFFTQALIH